MSVVIELGSSKIYLDNPNKKYVQSDTMKLKPSQQNLFNKIIETEIEPFSAVECAQEYFADYEISVKIYKNIVCWVKKLGRCSYTWNNLLNKPMYSLELFKNRMWPYIKVKNKEWNKIAQSAVEGAYPTEPAKKSDYADEIDVSQKFNNFAGYDVLDPSSYNDFNEFFLKIRVMMKLEMYMMVFEAIIKTMITPDFCHIIKDSRIHVVDKIFELSPKIKDVFLYYYYYAMFVLSHEDTVMFSRIKRNYRVIFTHQEALNLYEAHHLHIERDPYIQQLSNQMLNQSLVGYTRCRRSVNPVDVFNRRFQLATGGAFNNILLSNYGAAISGSILIPCVCYTELETDFADVRFEHDMKLDLYQDCQSEDEKDFMSYLEYYYPSYYSLKAKDYKAAIKRKKEDVIENDEKQDMTMPTKKYNTLSDIDISITTDNYVTFEDLAMLLFKAVKSNCRDKGDVFITKIHTATSFKFKIYGAGIIRPIDLFRISYGPHKMVKKFHCPIVRSWFDGCYPPEVKFTEELKEYWYDKLEQTVPVSTTSTQGNKFIVSCLKAILSGVNDNYKWFFNSKPCVEVILKYAQRGFSTIINQKEKTALIEYMKTSPRWKNYDIIGIISHKHQFFSPCVNGDGIRYKLRELQKPHKKYINNKLVSTVYNGVTKYNANLTIKTNQKVMMPSYANNTALYEYVMSKTNN